MPQGIGTVGGLGGEVDPERILKIFADQVQAYPLMDMDIFQWVQPFDRTGTPGNTQEVIYKNFGNASDQELAEGEDPEISHADLMSGTLTVKKYGARPAVTEEMIEDGRFDEFGLALEQSFQGMVNGYVRRFFTALKAAGYDSTDVPEPFMDQTWANAGAHLYSADHAGTPVAQSQAGHIYNTGAATLFEGDLSLAIRHIEEHGFRADTVMVGPELMQDIRDLVGFSKDFGTTDLPNELMRMGRPAGQIYGLNVMVVAGGRLANKEMIVASMASKPVLYLTKRNLRVDTHASNEADSIGWDVKAATLSARYGFDVPRTSPMRGAVVVATVSA